MSLSPHPQRDRLVSSTGEASDSYWGWFHDLRVIVNQLLTDAAAALARVVTLETTVADQATTIAAINATSISVPHDTADFTGSGGMTWGVDPGDVIKDRYARVGPLAVFTFEYYQTAVGGLLGSELRRRLPAATVAAADLIGQFGYVDNGTPGTGVWFITSGERDLKFLKDYNGTAWTGPVVSVFGQAIVEVTD